MVGWEYPPHNSGGLGVACEGLTKALSGLNTQIYFTLPYALPLGVLHMNVLDCSLPDDLVLGHGKPPFSVYSSVSRKPISPDMLDLQALPESDIEQKVATYTDLVVSKGVHSNNYDIIHTHDWMSYPAGIALKNKTNKPLVSHIHSTEFDRIPSGHGSHFIAHTEYEGLMASDAVIAVSEFTKRLLVEKYHIDPNKIHVVHNGVDKHTYQPTAHFAGNRPVIVFMGRLTQQKGADYFLRLAKSVMFLIPDVLFVVAGSGDQYHYLLLKNAEQHLSAHVLFTGFLRDKQREMLLNRASVFVMPSLSEPFGLVALEAAQRNTPVIVSLQSGVREVLHHAKHIDFWDVDKMSREIEHILKDKDYAQEIVSGQHQDLEHVTWNHAGQKVKNVYEKVIHGKH